MSKQSHHASPYKNLFYFTNGSIGDFLMVMYFAGLVQKGSPSMRIHIITPRNKDIFKELSAEYSFSIIECNQKSVSGILSCISLLRYIFFRNLVITPSTPGKIPFQTKLLAAVISISPASFLLGFNDQSKFGRRFYSKLFDFDESILYPDSMRKLAYDLGLSNSMPHPTQEIAEIPKLNFKKDPNILTPFGLKRNEYIILHPCGSSAGRSLALDEITAVLEALYAKFIRNNPTFKIVMTGSKKDSDYFASAIAGKNYIVNAAGKASINELENIIDFSAGFIGIDTGTTHLASMIGVKSLVISHESSVMYWLPYYNKNARILYLINNCPDGGIHEGFEHLKSCYNEQDRYLLKVPLKTILKAIESF